MRQGDWDARIAPAGAAEAHALRDADRGDGLPEPVRYWTTTHVSRRLAGVVLAVSLIPWLAVETSCAVELPVGLAVLAAWAALVLGIAVTVDLATGLGDRRVPPRQQWRFLAAITATSAGEWVIAILVLARGVSRMTAPWLLGGFALALATALLVARPLLGPRARLLVVAARHRRATVEAAARATGRRVVRWIDPGSEVLGLTLDEIDDDHDYDELALEDGCFVHLRDIPRALRHRALYIFVIERDRAASTVRCGLIGSPLSPVGKAFRRAVDISVATVLLAATAPLVVTSALAMHIDSPGGVILRQTRIGKNGRRFTMYALRTAPQHADEHRRDGAALRALGPRTDDARAPSIADARSSRVGTWMHRCGVDRVPTLWNVLTGTMTLIGPPPPLPSEVEDYTSAEVWRMRLKPGIVDLRGPGHRVTSALEPLSGPHGSS
jgi:lipopolysaccharide/colanic/teichoic acid biosynthesis glycosyltransferase